MLQFYSVRGLTEGNFMCCPDYNEVEFMSGTNAAITIKMSPNTYKTFQTT